MFELISDQFVVQNIDLNWSLIFTWLLVVALTNTKAESHFFCWCSYSSRISVYHPAQFSITAADSSFIVCSTEKRHPWRRVCVPHRWAELLGLWEDRHVERPEVKTHTGHFQLSLYKLFYFHCFLNGRKHFLAGKWLPLPSTHLNSIYYVMQCSSESPEGKVFAPWL